MFTSQVTLMQFTLAVLLTDELPCTYLATMKER